MIYRLEFVLRKVRSWFNRSEWLLRILGVKKPADTMPKAGLVIIQIDGLSYHQFNIALKNKRLPFIQKLIKQEQYHLHDLYSGTPSTTPSVQGELFYGVKIAVPAFSFRSQKSAQVVRMDRSQAASDVEEKLKQQGEPLLSGGSSYSNIYQGGALEANFCSSSLGWSGLMSLATPFSKFIFILLNIYSFVRVSILMVVEFILAVVDFFRGVIDRRDLLKELKFVPTRVAIVILLRELITIGTKLDVARGLPVIHLNLLGYDEQAHRRGPSSLFAHWSLKGIDDAIGRIWRAAKSSPMRDYDIWIYSDHGQEEAIPYAQIHGRSVNEAINQVFNSFRYIQDSPKNSDQALGIQSQRAKYLGGGKLQKLLPVPKETQAKGQGNIPDVSKLIVSAMGPLGSIYSDSELTLEERNEIAVCLVKDAKIPLVLTAVNQHQVKVWNESGEHMLPQDAALIFGSTHPFLADVTEDIIQLCQHPDAGDWLISGWALNKPYCSFAIENGAHGGPGPRETHAFALLPSDTLLPTQPRSYLRPIDLHASALYKLKRKKIGNNWSNQSKKVNINKTSLRVLSYNVHSCIGMDGRLSPRRIAKVIAQYQPDIVALQELDKGRSRTQYVDQAQIISEYLQMEFHFHPCIHVEEEAYGNAILTHLPLKLIKAGNLPVFSAKPWLEPRGIIWVEVELNDQQIQVFNTHLGLRPEERLMQVKTLLGRDWLTHPDNTGPAVLCGDFNSFPNSVVCKQIMTQLNDAQMSLQRHWPLNTFPGRFPGARIDHIFTNPMFKVINVEVPRTHLTRTASDHLPLIADVELDKIKSGSPI